MANMITRATNKAKTKVLGGLTVVTGAAEDAVDGVKNAAVNAYEGAKDMAIDAYEGTKNTVTGVVNGVQAKVEEVKTDISNGIDTAQRAFEAAQKEANQAQIDNLENNVKHLQEERDQLAKDMEHNAREIGDCETKRQNYQNQYDNFKDDEGLTGSALLQALTEKSGLQDKANDYEAKRKELELERDQMQLRLDSIDNMMEADNYQLAQLQGTESKEADAQAASKSENKETKTPESKETKERDASQGNYGYSSAEWATMSNEQRTEAVNNYNKEHDAGAKTKSSMQGSVMNGINNTIATAKTKTLEKVDEIKGKVQEVANQAAQHEEERVNGLADKVLSGEYGTGDARKEALGDDYDKVQSKVNDKVKTQERMAEIADIAIEDNSSEASLEGIGMGE